MFSRDPMLKKLIFSDFEKMSFWEIDLSKTSSVVMASTACEHRHPSYFVITDFVKSKSFDERKYNSKTFSDWADEMDWFEYCLYHSLVPRGMKPLSQTDYYKIQHDLQNQSIKKMKKEIIHSTVKKLKEWEMDPEIWIGGIVGSEKKPRSERLCSHDLDCKKRLSGQCDFKHTHPLPKSNKICKFGDKCKFKDRCCFKHQR